MSIITITDNRLPEVVQAAQTTEPLVNSNGDTVGRIAVTLAFLSPGVTWDAEQVEDLVDDELATMEALP